MTTRLGRTRWHRLCPDSPFLDPVRQWPLVADRAASIDASGGSCEALAGR